MYNEKVDRSCVSCCLCALKKKWQKIKIGGPVMRPHRRQGLELAPRNLYSGTGVLRRQRTQSYTFSS